MHSINQCTQLDSNVQPQHVRQPPCLCGHSGYLKLNLFYASFEGEEVRRRAEIETKFSSRADQRVLRWFGHVLRLGEYRMAIRVLIAKVSGYRVRGRPRLGWMDGVKVALGNRRMTVEAARKIGKSGEPWYICY